MYSKIFMISAFLIVLKSKPHQYCRLDINPNCNSNINQQENRNKNQTPMIQRVKSMIFTALSVKDLFVFVFKLESGPMFTF